MSGPVRENTPNYGFNLINFDFTRWHTYEWANWRTLDGLLTLALGGTTVRGSWENSTNYLVGDRVTDPNDGVIYFCLVEHTSAAVGTFADDRAANPTYWKNALEVPKFRGVWASGISYAPNDIVQYGFAYYFCVTPHTSDVAFDPVNWVLLFDYSAAMAASAQVCQCRFEYISATQCRLIPYNGNKIVINGATYTIPSAGVNIANTGIGNDVTRFVYVYNNAGTLTLEVDSADPAIDSTTSITIKPGDPTRTLVGMIRTNSSGQFVDSISQRYVLSFFNRRPKVQVNAPASNVVTAATGNQYITGLNNLIISWAYDAIVGRFTTLARLASAGSANIAYTTFIGGQGSYGIFTLTSTTNVQINLDAVVQKNFQSGQGAFSVFVEPTGQAVTFEGGINATAGAYPTQSSVQIFG